MSNLFGRTYNDIGTDTTDLLLKTRGLVKILIGNKFIDLIKDNELNTGVGSLKSLELYNILLPIGSIIMYNGLEAPNGWAICDGKTHGSITTPNLTDRFIKGSGTNLYSIIFIIKTSN